MIDYSIRELRLASTRLLKTTLIRGDVRGIPFEDNSFDWIVIVRVLHHIKDQRAMMEEIVRVAKNGATVVLGVMNMRFGRREPRVLEENQEVWISPHNIKYYMRPPEAYQHRDLKLVERRATGIFNNRIGRKLYRFSRISKIDEITSRLWFLPRAVKPELLILYRVTKDGKPRVPRIICSCGGIIVENTCNTCHKTYGKIIDLTESA